VTRQTDTFTDVGLKDREMSLAMSRLGEIDCPPEQDIQDADSKKGERETDSAWSELDK
jgi:hypothetical protein